MAKITPKKLEDTPGYNLESSGSVDAEELLWLHEQAKKMTSIVEIGSLRGRSTTALLAGCPGKVYAVDRWPGSEAHTVFMENCGHFENLVPVWEFAQTAIPMLPDADMWFHDGDHRYDFVIKELELIAPKAKKLICVHDYDRDECTDPDCWYGNEVKRAVNDFFGKGNFELFNSIAYVWIDKKQK